MGTAAGVTNFCGLHANVHGDIRQVVHGVADDLLVAHRRLGGLNTPHALFGKTLAQAYDTAAYKIAADDLLMRGWRRRSVPCARGRRGHGRPSAGSKPCWWKPSPVVGAILGRSFIDCSGDGDLAAWAGARFDKGDGQGDMLYPSTMFRVNGVDPRRAGKAWGAIPALMHEAEARR